MTTTPTTPPAGPDDGGFVAPGIEEARARLQMPMVEAMRTQRAVRRLHTDPVDLDLVYELLELSLKAPTSSNTQDWVYMVVTGREQKERLATLYLPLFRTFDPLVRRGAKTEQERRAMAPGIWQAEHFADIPVFVIPCYRTGLKHRSVGWPQISVSSFYGWSTPPCRTCCWRAGPSGWAPRCRRCRSGSRRSRRGSWASRRGCGPCA